MIVASKLNNVQLIQLPNLYDYYKQILCAGLAREAESKKTANGYH